MVLLKQLFIKAIILHGLLNDFLINEIESLKLRNTKKQLYKSHNPIEVMKK